MEPLTDAELDTVTEVFRRLRAEAGDFLTK
jgi:hypothetical protein